MTSPPAPMVGLVGAAPVRTEDAKKNELESSPTSWIIDSRTIQKCV